MENKDYKELYEEQLQKYFMECFMSACAWFVSFMLLLMFALEVIPLGLTFPSVLILIALVCSFCILKDTAFNAYKCWEENESILSKLTKRRKK